MDGGVIWKGARLLVLHMGMVDEGVVVVVEVFDGDILVGSFRNGVHYRDITLVLCVCVCV